MAQKWVSKDLRPYKRKAVSQIDLAEVLPKAKWTCDTGVTIATLLVYSVV